jgi:hypothetical protein
LQKYNVAAVGDTTEAYFSVSWKYLVLLAEVRLIDFHVFLDPGSAAPESRG